MLSNHTSSLRLSLTEAPANRAHQQGQMKVRRYNIYRLWICLLFVSLCLHAEEGRGAESLYETINLATLYILNHQNSDGGWPLISGKKSNVEVTAMAMRALMLKGWGTGSSVIRRGVRYLTTHQREDASWNGNAAHTIFALIALARAETDADARLNGLKWIKGAQNEDGSWGREMYQPGNPLYTAVVLSGLAQLGFNRRFSPVPKAADWLAGRINADGGWSMGRGTKSDVLVTSWVLQGLMLVYDIDEQLAWLKQLQNEDGGFSRRKGRPSDPEITAYVILALAAGGDPVNTDKIAIGYLKRVRQEDGSFVSATPIELTQPAANLQTTCFALWAIYARQLEEGK